MLNDKRPSPELHGVLVIDKPSGPTSHDVVAGVRRALGMRRVGHAGTLDPAASGVLVVLVGEATKLSPYLTAHSKEYAATVTFGESTNTWDADGEVIARGALPAPLAQELADVAAYGPSRFGAVATPVLHRALDAESLRTSQLPPAFSAIKQQGRSAHERARRGEEVQLAPRPVMVLDLRVEGATAHTLSVTMRVAKGYYVRAFAHDLAAAVDAHGHLSMLRRKSSGCFSVDEACSLAAPSLRDHVISLTTAVKRAMPCGVLTSGGATKASHGQRLEDSDFKERPPDWPAAWLDPNGELAAVGTPTPEGGYRSVRGFS